MIPESDNTSTNLACNPSLRPVPNPRTPPEPKLNFTLFDIMLIMSTFKYHTALLIIMFKNIRHMTAD